MTCHVIIIFTHNRGMLPSECDKKFLDLACRLDRYGMDFHQIVVNTHVLYIYITTAPRERERENNTPSSTLFGPVGFFRGEVMGRCDLYWPDSVLWSRAITH